MSKLPYTNFLQLISAHKQGAKFAVIDTDGARCPVEALHETPGGNLSVRYRRPGRSLPDYAYRWSPDGSHANTNARIVMTEPAAGALKVDGSLTTPSLSALGSNLGTLKAGALTMAPDNAPFLKRFVNGEPAYNPATREVVIGVSFVKGAIEVLLKAEDGTERVSTRYDHEGRHRWVTARSLVLGNLPPKKTKVELRIYLENFYGARRYVTLEKDQILPSNGRHHKLVSTVEIEV